jgi:hypothetical protein
MRWTVYVELAYHPLFTTWLEEVAEETPTIAAEIQALIDSLEAHGFDLGDPESHPVVTSRLGLRVLRRTPPTPATPDAKDPPRSQIRAVLLIGGDKTEAERRLTILAGQRGWKIIQAQNY